MTPEELAQKVYEEMKIPKRELTPEEKADLDRAIKGNRAYLAAQERIAKERG
jgi:hypothetical protein